MKLVYLVRQGTLGVQSSCCAWPTLYGWPHHLPHVYATSYHIFIQLCSLILQMHSWMFNSISAIRHFTAGWELAVHLVLPIWAAWSRFPHVSREGKWWVLTLRGLILFYSQDGVYWVKPGKPKGEWWHVQPNVCRGREAAVCMVDCAVGWYCWK